jgi:hypothetical protein
MTMAMKLVYTLGATIIVMVSGLIGMVIGGAIGITIDTLLKKEKNKGIFYKPLYIIGGIVCAALSIYYMVMTVASMR